MKPHQPKLPPKAALTLADASSFTAEARLEQMVFAGTDAIGAKAPNLHADETVFEKALLTQAKLNKMSLLDCELRGCDTSAATCSEGSIMRTRFVHCRMTGVDFNKSTLKDVVFEDCKLDMANLRFAKLTHVQFVDCEMIETDFQAAELTDISFQNCHLEKAEFAQSKLKNVDASSSQLIDIRGWKSLKGLTIDTVQLMQIAPQLAVELGLAVKK